jgi:hypothetical protein
LYKKLRSEDAKLNSLPFPETIFFSVPVILKIPVQAIFQKA